MKPIPEEGRRFLDWSVGVEIAMSRKRKAEQDKQEYYQRLLILNMKLLTHIDSKIEKTKSECKLLMSTPPTAIVQREGISVTLYKPYLLYKNKDEKEEAPFERLSPSISSTVYCLNRCYTFLTVGETRESRILKDGIAEIAKEAKMYESFNLDRKMTSAIPITKRSVFTYTYR